MKNYMRILAGILAVTMTVCAMPASTIKTNASSVESSEEITEEATKETVTEENTDAETEVETESESATEETSNKAENQTQDKIIGNVATRNTEVENTEAEEDTDSVEAQADEPDLTLDALPSEMKTVENTITVANASQLILLSNCDPKEIQNITIHFNHTGILDFTSETNQSCDYNGGKYLFRGIGSEECPFRGTIQGVVGTITMTNTFFNGLSSKANINIDGNGLKFIWGGDGSVPAIAEVYVMEDNGEHTLPVKITSVTGTIGALIGTVKASDSATNPVLKITKDNVDYTGVAGVAVEVSAGNAGLICNTLESGTICLDGYELPVDSYSIKTTAEYQNDDVSRSAEGNAGGLIGVMKSDTALQINTALSMNNATITSEKGNAGGMVGLMEQGAKIVTGAAQVKLEIPSISGGISAGGVIGTAENVTFADGDDTCTVTVKNPTITGSKSGAEAGGFIGNYTLNVTSSFPGQVIIESPKLTVNQSNTGFVGGYFGYLNLKGSVTYTIAGASESKKELSVTLQDCSVEAGGAIAGKVVSDTISSTLQIENLTTFTNNQSSTGMKYHGGLIGELGSAGDGTQSVYLETSNVEIQVANPSASESDGNGFGGIVGLLAQGSILKTTDNVTISTPKEKDGNECETTINRGGGLVGYAEKSVIDLSGTTDLSGVGYAAGAGKEAKTGWLVGRQESALIYAEGDGNGNGWTYIRGKENTTGKVAENDIGNYGQIIRLHAGESSSKLSSNLITINEKDHTVQFSSSLAYSGDEITINSEDEFGLLAIAWNTRGYFSAVTGVSENNFDEFVESKTKTIKLGQNDIDLTGSGIAGLTRDGKENKDIFTGTFNGNSKTITLSIGETFGFKQDNTTELAENGENGYGEVIAAKSGNTEYHCRQGLFAITTSGVIIQNVTINGVIWVSGAGTNILAGGIAGESSGATHLNVTVSETIEADCATNQVVAVGGFYGGCYSGDLQFGKYGDQDSINRASAVINIENCNTNTDDTSIFAGGLIGEANGMSKLKAYCVLVSGSITTSEMKYAYVGGLVGIIRNWGKVWVEIKGVTFDKFKIDAPEITVSCGGLFGGIWRNVGVYFMGESNGNDGEEIKLNVLDAEINAPNAEYVGGLVYRSGGNWELRKHGINLKKLTIQAGENVGLLVCRGEKGVEYINSKWSTSPVEALYLDTTEYWESEESSYKISEEDVTITTSIADGVFDEFVAYTAASAENITKNGVNGVISIATAEQNNVRVGVDTSGCSSYQNRTSYGKDHSTNGCSRYYYDLDQCQKNLTSGLKQNSNNSGKIDTPEEFLLWSVYNYACENIQSVIAHEEITNSTIPDIMRNEQSQFWTIDANALDLKGYSYYPINYDKESVAIENTTITFYNQEIEDAETNADEEKSTQGTDANHTQHYLMHCGLFLDYQAVSNDSALTLNNVTFAGTVGKVNSNNSGALVAGTVKGCLDSTTKKVYTAAINAKTVTLDNLRVNGYEGTEYAPLFINQIGEYSTLDVNGLTTKKAGEDGTKSNTYKEGTAIASSLIGNVGSDTATQVKLSFLEVALPDRKADGKSGIFSHATLLESFAYAENDNTSGATYNFYKDEDWSGNTHIHEVTYGKEIRETAEFVNLQKWYYDKATYREDAGLVYDNSNDTTNFNSSEYLPYVYVSYDPTKNTHEIKVNQRVSDIVSGCGTYGHPYEITSVAEMEILSNYMASGMPQKDWKVTITGDPSAYHVKSDNNSTNDVTYQYNGSEWVQVKENSKDQWTEVTGKDTLPRDFMRQYLLNAYYDLQGTNTDETTTGQSATFKLENFGGFGTKEYPFRGVLTSSTGVTIELSGAKTGNGLIPYSAGCVVRDLTVSYKKTSNESGKTLTYNTTDGTKYNPIVYFGGVIGCVLGGDNIIDSVTVEVEKDWLTLSGEKKHLIQVGGYVGSVSGGGVIFRNMTDANGLTADAMKDVSNIRNEDVATNLYVNPYVGRVLDGFAFYEKTDTEKEGVLDSIDNTNKNYKINPLTTSGTASVSVSGTTTVTANNAQGLLVLSAIINSGAASNGISNAYNSVLNTQNKMVDNIPYQFGGSGGKVRSASYEKIGTQGGKEEAELSMADDQTAPGNDNLPYLIQKYCGKAAKVFSISDSQGTIKLSANGSFDMTGYGNGYQGIGGRYVSNAEQGIIGSTTGTLIVDDYPEGIVTELSLFDGNDQNVTMSMQVKEYADDDFHAASVGGLFNVLRIAQNGTISNVVIGNQAEDGKASVVSLSYYNDEGAELDNSKNVWMNQGEVGLGGFAGSLVGYTDSWMEDGEQKHNYDITVRNITIQNLVVTSPASAGGIFGNAGKRAALSGVEKKDKTDIVILLQPKTYQLIYGINFTECSYTGLSITGRNAAGGFAGYIENKDQNPVGYVIGFKNQNESTGTDSVISGTGSGSWAGGIFGYVETRMFVNRKNSGQEKSETYTILQNVNVSAGTAAGGCIGWIGKDNGSCYGIHNVTVKAVSKTNAKNGLVTLLTDKKGTFYAGGIIGYAYGAAQNWTENWTNAGGISNSTVDSVQINNEGLAGYHDYTGANGIQTNYIVGGMIGLAKGGTTELEICKVNSGKIYGSASGGMVGQTESELLFSDCEVKGASESSKGEVKGFSTAGGFLGFWKTNASVSIQDSVLQYMSMEGKDWGSGALIGDVDGNSAGGTLYVFDSLVSNSDVTATGNANSVGGRWPCVGGVTGNLRNNVKASNVLFSDVELSASNGSYSNAKKGLLFGSVVGDPSINIAGISIQNIPNSNEDWNLTGNGSATTDNDYIAFADYSGAAVDVDSEASQKDLMGEANPKVPYVVTSPIGTMSLPDDDSNGKNLYGDGVSWDKKTLSMKAKEIWENQNAVTDGHYGYTNIGIKDTNFDVSSLLSTYNNNNLQSKIGEDFPVLQITAGNADMVTSYLDILTNGGFSAANKENAKSNVHVRAKTDVYTYKNGTFVKSSDGTAGAFSANTDGNTNKISFQTTTEYDNDRNRFTLLTVTFTEKDKNGAEHNYNVFVPVLVRRMLEIDFMATLTYGTDFNKSDYDNLEAHVLDQFGNAITGYLTYRYNSAKGVAAEFGWESYINAGGDVTKSMEKSIGIVTSDIVTLPKGMQLTLVEPITGRAYYYTADGTEKADNNRGFNIKLSSFKDSSGKAYEEPSIGELMIKSVESGSNNIFVKVDENGKPENGSDDKTYSLPTIKFKDEYYRLAEEEEKGAYTVTAIETPVDENYYLVITIPKNAAKNAGISLVNGSIQPKVDNSEIPHQVHEQLRKYPTQEDNHQTNVSTFVLSSGYTQDLKELENITTPVKLVSVADTKLQVGVRDTITFPNNQAYNENDQLYLRIVGSLQNWMNKKDSTTQQFPSGASGMATFYIYTRDDNGKKTYYRYTETKEWEPYDIMTTFTRYKWTSDGSNMELLLSTDGTMDGIISLQWLRDRIKDPDGNGNSTFYVEVQMEVSLPSSGLDVIPESKLEDGEPINYAKLAYVSQLSTEKQSLSYSSNRAYASNTTTKYYQEEPAGATLTYEPDQIDQLGINMWDLRYLDASKEHSLIDTTAVYNLSEMKDLEDVLKKSDGVKFTLQLLPKDTTVGNQEDYGAALKDARDYLSVELKSADSGADETGNVSYENGIWSWTVPKGSYWKDGTQNEDGTATEGSIRTDLPIFDGSVLTQQIQLKVNVANVESEKHLYSNYKVVLSAEIVDADGKALTETKSDNIIYTLARILPEFVDPSTTSGGSGN